MENKKIIGEVIKSARIKNGLTQKDVADSLGIQRSTYASYELGNIIVPTEKLFRLAKILKIDINSLFGDERVAISAHKDLTDKIIDIIKSNSRFSKINITKSEEDLITNTLEAILSYLESK